MSKKNKQYNPNEVHVEIAGQKIYGYENLNDGIKIMYNENKEVYLVGVVDDLTWGLIGIFTDKKVAIANCLTVDHFYAVIKLDDSHHGEKQEFDNYVFPHRPITDKIQ